MKMKSISLLVMLLTMMTQGAWAQFNVTKDDATMNEDWNVTPGNPVTTGATVTATYNGSKHVKSVKFVKKLRTPEVTAPIAKDGLAYTGSPIELVDAGTTTGGTMQYKVGSGTYSESIPTATNAGTYIVYYKVVGGEAYSDVAEASISVTIAKVAATAKTNKANWAVGDIICGNGYAYTVDVNHYMPTFNSAKTAIVAYKGSATGDGTYKNGLALALTDASDGSVWKTTKGTSDNSTKIQNATTSESGRDITYKQQTYGKRSDGTKESRETWIAFYNAGYIYNSSVFYPSSTTSAWFLPSIYQWNQIVKGLLGVSTNLTTSANVALAYDRINAKLKYAIEDEQVNATALANAAYWTASENTNDRAWCYRANGLAGYNDKNGSLHVRPVIAF